MDKKFRLLTAILLWQLCGWIFAQSGYVFTEELESQYASRSIYVCSDNSVVVLGNSDTLEELHSTTIAITKLDPQGNLQWRRYIDPGIYTYISITGVDIDNDDRVTFITTFFSGSIIQLGSISSAGIINLALFQTWWVNAHIRYPHRCKTFNRKYSKSLYP